MSDATRKYQQTDERQAKQLVLLELCTLVCTQGENEEIPLVQKLMASKKAKALADRGVTGGQEVRLCNNGHPLKLYPTVKERGGSKIRRSISKMFSLSSPICDICDEKIPIKGGSYSCEQDCDFDVHQKCFDRCPLAVSEQSPKQDNSPKQQQRICEPLLCRNNEQLERKEAGFLKYF